MKSRIGKNKTKKEIFVKDKAILRHNFIKNYCRKTKNALFLIKENHIGEKDNAD